MSDQPTRRLTDAEVADVVALLKPHRQLLVEHGRSKKQTERAS